MLGSGKVTCTETNISAVVMSVCSLSPSGLHKGCVKVSPTHLIWPVNAVSYGLSRSQLKSGHRLLPQRLKEQYILSGINLNGLGSPENVNFLSFYHFFKMLHELLHLDGSWFLSLIPKPGTGHQPFWRMGQWKGCWWIQISCNQSLGGAVVAYFFLKKLSNCFPEWWYHFCIPISNVWVI